MSGKELDTDAPCPQASASQGAREWRHRYAAEHGISPDGEDVWTDEIVEAFAASRLQAAEQRVAELERQCDKYLNNAIAAGIDKGLAEKRAEAEEAQLRQARGALRAINEQSDFADDSEDVVRGQLQWIRRKAAAALAERGADHAD